MKVKDNPLCFGCPMLKVSCDYETKGRKVHHEGSEQTFVPPQIGPSLRLVVAEAPGETEGHEGKPLVGAAGNFFNLLARKAGIDRETLTIINCVNCRPPNNKFPGDLESRFYISEQDAQKAIKQCVRNHVLPLLESRPWTRLDLLGAKALYWIAGLKDGIQKWRGSPLEIDTDQVRKRVQT